MGWLRRYAHWLHTGWPSGRVEKLPAVASDGSTRIPGLYVAGDHRTSGSINGALRSGRRAAEAVAADLGD